MIRRGNLKSLCQPLKNQVGDVAKIALGLCNANSGTVDAAAGRRRDDIVHNAQRQYFLAVL